MVTTYNRFIRYKKQIVLSIILYRDITRCRIEHCCCYYIINNDFNTVFNSVEITI